MTKLTTYLKRCKEAWWRNMEQWFWTNPLNKLVRHPWCAHQFLYWVTAGGKHISNQSRFTQNQSSVNLNVLCVFIEKNIIARVQNNFSLGVSHGVGLGIKDMANHEGCHGVMGHEGCHGSWRRLQGPHRFWRSFICVRSVLYLQISRFHSRDFHPTPMSGHWLMILEKVVCFWKVKRRNLEESVVHSFIYGIITK